jgi:hypothetical protein
MTRRGDGSEGKVGYLIIWGGGAGETGAKGGGGGGFCLRTRFCLLGISMSLAFEEAPIC